jgi:thiol-disulfide isomerase/thioredoxin
MRVLFLGIYLFSMIRVQGQTQKVMAVRLDSFETGDRRPLSALGIGDRLPNLLFRHVFNVDRPSAEFNDFRTKLIILDFWNTHCAPCISAFPKMQALQDKFAGALQVILVDGHSQVMHDDSLHILKTLKWVEQTNGIQLRLPVVYESPELDSCFTYTGVPHEVWLDGQDRVLAVTRAEEVNEQNIRDMLDGKKVRMRMKVEAPISWNTEIETASLQEIIDREGMPNRPAFYSTLYKGYIDGPQGWKAARPDSVHTGMYRGLFIANDALFDICKTAYSTKIDLPDNQIIIEVKDSLAFVRYGRSPSGSNTLWYDNSWTYDLQCPSVSREQLYEIVQEDLKRYFGISMFLETRPLTCMVIRAGQRIRKSFSKGGTGEFMAGSGGHFVRNMSIGSVIENLNIRSSVPLIDSTGMSRQPIDMELPSNVYDLPTLSDALKAAGFELTEVRRPTSVAIVKQE